VAGKDLKTMPVEIRELIIRAVVDAPPAKPDDKEASATTIDTNAIIEECVRHVLKILKKSGER